MATPALGSPEGAWEGGEAPERYPLLLAGGVLLLLAGAACAVLAVFAVFGLAMSWHAEGAPLRLRWSLPGLFWYLAGAVAFAWVGIGLLVARRWAWTLAVAGAWVWLVQGTLGLVTTVASLPSMLAAMPAVAQAPAGVIRALTATFSAGWALLAGVAVPATLLVLSTRKGVRITCERRDPGPSWSDRCPVAVVPLALALAAGAVYEAVPAAAGQPSLWFGEILSGARALAAGLGSGAVGLLLAVFVFRRAPWAWWAATAYTVVWAVSAFMAVGVDLAPVYADMGVGTEWTEGAWGTYASFASDAGACASAVAALLWIGWAVLQRRHFRGGPPVR